MNRLLTFFIRCAVAAFVCITVAGPALARYPDKVVRLVVPYPPGGGVDVIARALAVRLGQAWGQPVIVENKPGAGTNIGAGAVVRARPDGYTLLVTTDSTVTTNPHLFKEMPFDSMKDLVPLAHVVDLNLVVLVNGTSTINSMGDLLVLAKGKDVPYGSSGIGSQAHLMFDALNQTRGTRFSHIPYAGIAPALRAAVANEVLVTLGGGTSFGLIESRKLRPIAVSGEKRVPALPGVPTLKEAGYGQVDPRGWVGLFAPAGVPVDVTLQIEKDVLKVLADPEFQKTTLDSIAFSLPADSSSRAFAAFLRQDLELKKALVATSRVKLD